MRQAPALYPLEHVKSPAEHGRIVSHEMDGMIRLAESELKGLGDERSPRFGRGRVFAAKRRDIDRDLEEQSRAVSSAPAENPTGTSPWRGVSRQLEQAGKLAH